MATAQTKAKRHYEHTAEHYTTPVKELPAGKVKAGRQSPYIAALAKIQNEYPGQWVLVMTSRKDNAAANTRSQLASKSKGEDKGWDEVDGTKFEFAAVSFDDDTPYKGPDGKLDKTVKSACYAKFNA